MPEGDVTVEVAYSTLNYKDALAITGKAPIAKTYPMVPGIDLAGVVTESDNPDFKPGDQVVLNGWGVGEKHWGGLAEKARLSGDWLIPLQAPVYSAPGHGHWHRGLHRHVMRDRPGEAGRQAGFR